MTDASTYAEIAEVVRTYVEGMCQNDPAKLRTAMHERACSIGHFERELEWEGREGFIALVGQSVKVPNPAPWYRINAISLAAMWRRCKSRIWPGADRSGL